jgi:D-amino-acid oxidase
MTLSRRALLSSALAPLAGCAARTARVATPAAPQAPRLARVDVSDERVIRVSTGLRPYRPSGFVVRAEKIGEKLVVHNYGHGGAGITLSWGTSRLAVDEGLKSGIRDCAVVGCGVMGLSTARLLQESGLQPVIYTKDQPPNTTSNIAGGYWSPVTLYDAARATPEFLDQFNTASHYAHRRFQSYASEEYGVHWRTIYRLGNQPYRERAATNPLNDLYLGKTLSGAENPFAVVSARREHSMIIEPAIYLNALRRDFFISGGKMQIREISPQDLTQLPERLIFNCTGLGARALVNDQELTPIKGQLVFLVPQPEIDYCTLGPGDIYMFPRRDGILLGGSHDEGVWDLTPDAATTARILHENGELFGRMRATAT